VNHKNKCLMFGDNQKLASLYYHPTL